MFLADLIVETCKLEVYGIRDKSRVHTYLHVISATNTY